VTGQQEEAIIEEAAAGNEQLKRVLKRYQL
jgi:hypothetical protein